MQRKNGRRKKIAYVLCGILAVVLFSGCQSTAADGTDEKEAMDNIEKYLSSEN